MSNTVAVSEWQTPKQIAAEILTGPGTVYGAIRSGELKAAVVNGRGDLRVHTEWKREWLTKRAERATAASL
jgi:hypothetical protein